ncbi:MAG: hypothetical protein R3330_05435, partial [Saprospiraceae bacterium]|nr:hypothetical protein [Saprospiraceae bacterium]
MRVSVKYRQSGLFFILAACLAFGTWQCSADQDVFEQGRWVDLSYPFDAETIYWPTAAGFRLDT